MPKKPNPNSQKVVVGEMDLEEWDIKNENKTEKFEGPLDSCLERYMI